MLSRCMRKSCALMLLPVLAACGSSDDGAFSSKTSRPSDGSAPVEDPAGRALAIGAGEGDNFHEGIIDATAKQLSPGGSSQLTFSIIDRNRDNALMTGESTELTITSACLSAATPLASIDVPATLSTSSGRTSFKYSAEGCNGRDTVTASLVDGGSASVTLDIIAASAVAIESAAPFPSSIAPDGVGSESRPNTSKVVFTVVDNRSNPVPAGKEVAFRLSFPGGQDLGDGPPRLENENSRDITSSIGEVTAIVRAGTQNTVVRVVASLVEDGRTIETTSAPIAINTMVPHQAGFSLSASNFAPNAWAYNGVPSEITVRANDLYGDHIRGGTVVGFTTTGGAISGDCELDEKGACTVTWISQDPRPADGRVMILARTVGDESFLDLNSNGILDDDEDLLRNSERGEAFYDINQNGTRDSDESYFGDDDNGTYDGPDGIYDGSGCPQGAESSRCTQGPVTVWRALHLTMASDRGVEIDINESEGRYCADVSARAGGTSRTPLPAGTTVEFTVGGDGEISSERTVFTVSHDNNWSNISDPFCVEATGPDRLTVTVTPPAPFDGDAPQAFIDIP